MAITIHFNQDYQKLWFVYQNNFILFIQMISKMRKEDASLFQKKWNENTMKGMSRTGKNAMAWKKIPSIRKKMNPDDDFPVAKSAFQNPSDTPFYPKRYPLWLRKDTQLLRLMEEWYQIWQKDQSMFCPNEWGMTPSEPFSMKSSTIFFAFVLKKEQQ